MSNTKYAMMSYLKVSWSLREGATFFITDMKIGILPSGSMIRKKIVVVLIISVIFMGHRSEEARMPSFRHGSFKCIW